jgi:hypothetical protein
MLPSGFIRPSLLATFSVNQRSPPGEDGQRPEWNRLARVGLHPDRVIYCETGKMQTCWRRWKKGYGMAATLALWASLCGCR